jgi:thioredoxin reductase (NADPH)
MASSPPPHPPLLDCLIIGGGPAGLTAALYLARFNRRFLLVDGGASRAAWIPASHNFPVFSNGVAGPRMLALQREHLGRYDVSPQDGCVKQLTKVDGAFEALVTTEAGTMNVHAKRVLLATGAVDVEPDLPNLPDAMRRGLLRYCPICDGYEARGRRVAVIGHGDRGLGEAIFVARTYSHDVTLLTLGQAMQPSAAQHQAMAEHGVKLVPQAIDHIAVEGDRIVALRAGGQEYRFETMYSALGLRVRSELAVSLGADHTETGALVVDAHNQTTVRGLYAAGDTVAGLNQIVVAMGHAAVAATDIHNRCELPTEDE